MPAKKKPTPPKNKGGRPKNERNRSFADKAGLSLRRVQQLVKEAGIDAVEDGVAAKQLKTLLEAEKVGLDAKTAAVKLDREQLELDRARGEVVKRADVREQGLRLAAVISAELAAMCDDSPGELEGLNAMAIRRKLSERCEKLKATIKQELRK